MFKWIFKKKIKEERVNSTFLEEDIHKDSLQFITSIQSNSEVSYMLDGKKYKSVVDSLTGEEILSRAGLEWQRYYLQIKMPGGTRVPIRHDWRIDLTHPKLERFETIPLAAQQGVF